MLSNIDNFKDVFFEIKPKLGFKSFEAPKFGYPPPPYFVYPWKYEEDREIKDSKKPRLLIISDSFGENLFPFLSEKFSRSVKIFDSWQYKLNLDIIRNEKPDVVLLLVLESNIRCILHFSANSNIK